MIVFLCNAETNLHTSKQLIRVFSEMKMKMSLNFTVEYFELCIILYMLDYISSNLLIALIWYFIILSWTITQMMIFILKQSLCWSLNFLTVLTVCSILSKSLSLWVLVFLSQSLKTMIVVSSVCANRSYCTITLTQLSAQSLTSELKLIFSDSSELNWNDIFFCLSIRVM